MSKKTDVDPLSYSQVADSSNRWRGLRWLRVDAAALYFLWFHNPFMLTDEYFHRQHNTLFHVRWATTSCFFLTNCTEISEEHQETPNFLFLVISLSILRTFVYYLWPYANFVFCLISCYSWPSTFIIRNELNWYFVYIEIRFFLMNYTFMKPEKRPFSFHLTWLFCRICLVFVCPSPANPVFESFDRQLARVWRAPAMLLVFLSFLLPVEEREETPLDAGRKQKGNLH